MRSPARRGAARSPQLPEEVDMDREIEDDNIRPPPHYHEDGPPQVLTPDTARQGPKGSRVLVVLVCALALAAIAWLAVAYI
jgi:hypothetical protein